MEAKAKKPYLIGLTGGIASGKSSALEIFKEQGIPTIDCDKIVSKLWEDASFRDVVRKTFNVDADDKKLKMVVSTIVYENKDQLAKLNNLTHPLVLTELDKKIKEHQASEIIVIDMPLLFEIDYKKVDTTVLIYVPEQEQIKRLSGRNNITGAQAKKMIDLQMPLSKKYFLADTVIDNSGTLYQLGKEIKDYLKEIKNEIK